MSCGLFANVEANVNNWEWGSDRIICELERVWVQRLDDGDKFCI